MSCKVKMGRDSSCDLRRWYFTILFPKYTLFRIYWKYNSRKRQLWEEVLEVGSDFLTTDRFGMFDMFSLFSENNDMSENVNKKPTLLIVRSADYRDYELNYSSKLVFVGPQ